MNEYTDEDFQQWKENPVTKAVLAAIKSEKEDKSKLDEKLCNMVISGHATQEQIALDSLARSSFISGLSAAMDIIGGDYEI